MHNIYRCTTFSDGWLPQKNQTNRQTNKQGLIECTAMGNGCKFAIFKFLVYNIKQKCLL